MRVLAVDDEMLALNRLVKTIGAVMPTAEICAFAKYPQALAFASEAVCDIAFLDIDIRGRSGIELAKEIKDINPRTNVIFVTGYAQYTADAFSVMASGYLLKPVTAEAVEAELSHLRYPLDPKVDNRLIVQCFGNFEVFFEGKAVIFARTKTKELFAYLIDRRGAWCDVHDLAAVLWEGKVNAKTQQAHLRILVSDLTQTLRSIGAEHIVLKRRGMLAASTTGFYCDYYAFVHGDVDAINSYAGKYMSQYSWAEFNGAALFHAATRSERRFASDEGSGKH